MGTARRQRGRLILEVEPWRLDRTQERKLHRPTPSVLAHEIIIGQGDNQLGPIYETIKGSIFTEAIAGVTPVA